MSSTYERPRGCQIPNLEKMYVELFGYRSNGFFIEVGAFDCLQWSNTWGLAMAGWSGVYIEPQPDLASKCRERFEDRDDITIIEGAASYKSSGSAALRLGGSLSTVKGARAKEYDQSKEFGHVGVGSAELIEVSLVSLDKVLNEIEPYSFEVLSIDVEGAEMDVLHGLSIQYWNPAMVIVEAHEQHEEALINYRASEINDYFERAGYDKVYSDAINNIYTRRS